MWRGSGTGGGRTSTRMLSQRRGVSGGGRRVEIETHRAAGEETSDGGHGHGMMPPLVLHGIALHYIWSEDGMFGEHSRLGRRQSVHGRGGEQHSCIVLLLLFTILLACAVCIYKGSAGQRGMDNGAA